MADPAKVVLLVFGGAMARRDIIEEFIKCKEGRDFAGSVAWAGSDVSDDHRVCPKDVAEKHAREVDLGREGDAREKIAAYKKGLKLLVDLLERQELLDAAILLQEDFILVTLLIEGKTEEYFENLINLALLMRAAGEMNDAMRTLKHTYKTCIAEKLPVPLAFWSASATIFLETGKLERALKCFNQLLKHDLDARKPIEMMSRTFEQIVALNVQLKRFRDAAMAQREYLNRLIVQTDEPRTQEMKGNIGEQTDRLGNLLLQSGNYAASVTIFEQALAIFKNLQDIRRCAQVQLKAAKSLRVLNSEPRALELLRSGLDMLKEEKLSGIHDTSIAIHEEMAKVYISQGWTAKAREHLPKALRLRKEINGVGSVEFAMSTNLRSDLARMEGHLKKAIILAQRSLKTLLKEAGPRSGEVALTYGRLGTLMLEFGKLNEAQEYLLLALDIDRGLSGDESLEVAADLIRVTELLNEQGKYGEAMSVIAECLRVRHKLLDSKDHTNDAIGEALNRKARTFEGLDKYDEAEELFLEAIAIGKQQLGERHVEIINRMCDLGKLYMRLDKLINADRILKETLQMCFGTFGSHHPRTALVLGLLSSLLTQRQRYKEAETVATRAMAINLKYFGRSSAVVARNIDALGHIAMHKQDLDHSESLIREALQIRVEIFGQQHPEVAHSMESIALLMKERGDSEESAGYGLGALAIYEATLGDDHPLSEEARIRWF